VDVTVELRIVNINGLAIPHVDVSANISPNVLLDISGIRKLVIVSVSLRHVLLDSSKAPSHVSASRDAFKVRCVFREKSGIRTSASVCARRFKYVLPLSLGTRITVNAHNHANL
jgi:hypothetical protein